MTFARYGTMRSFSTGTTTRASCQAAPTIPTATILRLSGRRASYPLPNVALDCGSPKFQSSSWGLPRRGLVVADPRPGGRHCVKGGPTHTRRRTSQPSILRPHPGGIPEEPAQVKCSPCRFFPKAAFITLDFGAHSDLGSRQSVLPAPGPPDRQKPSL